ncbi:MAG: APC family permease [Bacteroidetes bacterium]|nr:APC family permease [Bacteroidota bacterium]
MKDLKLKDYMRDSSGLVKEFNTFDVFIFNVLGFSLGVVLAIAPTFLGKNFPNANPYIVLILGTGLAVLNGYVYSLFAAAMPRSGGEYEYVGRTFSHRWGFIASWGFSWSQFLGLGVYTAWCVQTALSPSLLNIGYSIGSNELVALGKSVSTPMNSFIIGTLILIVVYVVSALGIRTLKKFLNIFFWISLLGTVITIVLFLTTNHKEFIELFNQYMMKHANYNNAYDTIIELAKQQGLEEGKSFNFFDTIMALPIGYWMFIGFTYSAYVGGEVKKADKSQTKGIIGALLFGFVFYLLALGAYYSTVGKDFNNAISLIQGTENSPLLVDNSVNSLAGVLTQNTFLNIVMGISNFLWYMLLLFVMTQVCSRNLFAWAHYRVFPKEVSKVNEKNGAPTVSLLIIVLMAILFLGLFLFTSLSFINYIAIFSVSFLITGIAALFFASNNNSVFKRAPSIVTKKIFGVYLMKIAGIGNTILFLILLYSSLTNSGVGGTTGILPIILLIGIYVSGFIVYLISKKINAKKGVELDQEMSITLSED